MSTSTMPGSLVLPSLSLPCSRLDLSSLYARIDARASNLGAPAIDPKLLLGLWVYATSDGENSAQEIQRLTELFAAYRWLCGGVSLNHHTLSDFRSARTAAGGRAGQAEERYQGPDASLTLRGLDKALASVTLFALTYDILRAITLGA